MEYLILIVALLVVGILLIYNIQLRKKYNNLKKRFHRFVEEVEGNNKDKKKKLYKKSVFQFIPRKDK